MIFSNLDLSDLRGEIHLLFTFIFKGLKQVEVNKKLLPLSILSLGLPEWVKKDLTHTL